MQTADFLSLVFGRCSPTNLIALTAMKPKGGHAWTKQYANDHAGRLRTEAKVLETRGLYSLYYNVALSGRLFASESVRGSKSDCVEIPIAWADLDTDAKGEKYPPLGRILEAINSLPIQPSLLVHSGLGVHPIWILDRPIVLLDEGEQGCVEWEQKLFRPLLALIEGRLGSKVDPVGDATRMLRIPGGVNFKNGRDVTFEQLGGDPVNVESLLGAVKSVGSPLFVSAVASGLPENGEVYEGNGHAGKTTEEWNRIGRGVGEGERNNTAASVAGKLLSVIDVSDPQKVESLYQVAYLPWCDRCSPPLDRKESDATWRSILKRERSKSQRVEVEQRSRVDPDAATLSDGTPSEWGLRISNQRPRVYLLTAPFWTGEWVELEEEDILNPGKISIRAITQTNLPHDPNAFARSWLRTRRQPNTPGAMEICLASAEYYDLPPDRGRITILAGLIHAPCVSDGLTGEFEAGDMVQNIKPERVNVRRAGGVITGYLFTPGFMENYVKQDSGREYKKSDIAQLLESVGVMKPRQFGPAGCRGPRYYEVSPDSLEKLDKMRWPSE